MKTTFTPGISSNPSMPAVVSMDKIAPPSFFSGLSSYVPSLSGRNILIAGAGILVFLFLRSYWGSNKTLHGYAYKRSKLIEELKKRGLSRDDVGAYQSKIQEWQNRQKEFSDNLLSYVNIAGTIKAYEFLVQAAQNSSQI